MLYRNIGVAGHRLDLAYRGFDTVSPAYLTPGVPNVYFSDYGHNDIKTYVNDAATAVDTIEAMKAQVRHMAARLRAYGFDMVIWQEAYADTSFTVAQESARDAWNAWLRSNPISDDGLACFDAVDTVASDAAFVLSDAETDATRGMALTVNSSDGVHPNEVHAGTRADHLLATYAAIPFRLKICRAGRSARAALCRVYAKRGQRNGALCLCAGAGIGGAADRTVAQSWHRGHLRDAEQGRHDGGRGSARYGQPGYLRRRDLRDRDRNTDGRSPLPTRSRAGMPPMRPA